MGMAIPQQAAQQEMLLSSRAQYQNISIARMPLVCLECCAEHAGAAMLG